MSKYFDKMAKDNKYYTVEDHILEKMTIEQLNTLGKLNSKVKASNIFIGRLFNKVNHTKLDRERIEDLSFTERRQELVEMYDSSRSHPQSFRTALLHEILEIGLKLDIFDKAHFLEYLKHPQQRYCLKDKNYSSYQDSVWNQYLSNIQSNGGYIASDKIEKMYYTYLEHFYRESGGNLSAFQSYFEKYYWEKTILKIEFLSGKDLKSLNGKNFSTDEYEILAKKVEIELVESNKPMFKPDERVRIVTELKNVPTLYVKIFEFNSENYYRKNMAPFRTDVNLDGLIASHEESFTFSELPQMKFRHVFDFPSLDNKVGLYVIEFIANGFSSRAVIKKGTLSLVTRSSIAGHIAYILDENRNICTGDKTGMWFDDNYFKADPEKGGRIIIPYEKYSNSGSSILIHNEFAQLADFNRLTETYSLNCSYVLHPESLLMGMESKILVRPQLTVNGRPCDLRLLKNNKIKLTTTSFIDNIPVTKDFDNLELNSSEEIVLTFQVPPNLDKIDIEYESDLTNVTKGEKEKFHSSYNYAVRNHKDSHQFYDYYLQKQNGEYVFLMLGKNGEPQDDVTVRFDFGHNYMNKQFSSGNLTTDVDGKIFLGPLNDMYQITSFISSSNGQQ